VADDSRPPGSAGPEREPNGRWLRGDEAGRVGGMRKASSRKMAEDMGMDALPASYRRSAHDFKRSQIRELQCLFGAENVGRASSSFVTSASIQLAWSRVFTDRGDQKSMGLATKLANDSKGNLKAAYELCAMAKDVRSGRNPAQEATSALAALLGGGEKKGT